MDDHSLLSTNIRLYREQANMTQDELAKNLGIGSRTTITSWEIGHSSPDASLIPHIAEVLHVTIEDLYTGAFKVSTNILLSKNISTYSDEIRDFLNDAGNISRETAEKCRRAIADELTARSKTNIEYEPIEFPLFLTKRHVDYFEMKDKATKLRKLKRQHCYSYSDIRGYMNSIDNDYDEHICLAYYFLLFTGDKVPSRQLYERLYSLLSKPNNKNDINSFS